VVQARLAGTALDCSDTRALAAFWAELLGGETAFESDAFCAVKTSGGWLSTVHVEDYQPRTWPAAHVPKQMHLEVAVQDLDAAEAEAIRIGARKADHQPTPERWRVFLNPAGHPFCLTTGIPD
jgi:hypothetical protein